MVHAVKDTAREWHTKFAHLFYVIAIESVKRNNRVGCTMPARSVPGSR